MGRTHEPGDAEAWHMNAEAGATAQFRQIA